MILRRTTMQYMLMKEFDLPSIIIEFCDYREYAKSLDMELKDNTQPLSILKYTLIAW